MRLAQPLLALLFATACGAAASSATSPSSHQDAADEESAAPSAQEVRSVMLEEAHDACARACAHIASCAGSEAATDCESDCRASFAQSSGAPAMRYAGCVEGLSCDVVKHSMTMSMGPVGACYTAALRMAR